MHFKKFHIKPLLLFAIALLLLSCEKSFENFTPISTIADTDTAWVNNNTSLLPVNDLHQALMRSAATDSFNLQTGAVLSLSGTRIQIPANGFGSANSIATGMANLSFYLLKNKGDLIRFRKPSASNGYAMQHIGTLYLNITKNGQSLPLLFSKNITVNFINGQVNALAKGYVGIEPASTSFDVFNRVRDTLVSVTLDSGSYKVITGQLPWLGCGYLLDSTSVKSRTVLDMPSGFTNANTSVFLVFNNHQTVMQMTPDIANRIWKVEKIPTGESVTYITLTQKGNDYWLGSQQITTAINQNIHIVPVQSTLSAINNVLNNL